jgi:hypothetical protein
MAPRWTGGRPPQLAKKSRQCRLSVAMTSGRFVTALASTPQAPRRRFRVAYSTAAVARYSRATAQRLQSAPDLLPRSRCATALASKWPLARLRLAGSYRVGCSATPEAAPLALSHLLPPSRQRRLFDLAQHWRLLPAACAVSVAHGSVGCLNPGLLAALGSTKAAPG